MTSSLNHAVIIYHNPRCSKSRGACILLDKKTTSFEIRDYLEKPLTEKELKKLLKKLGMKAEDIVRKSDEIYKKEFKNKKLSEAGWIKALAQNPILIERPIIVRGNKAVIGRPPENIEKLF